MRVPRWRPLLLIVAIAAGFLLGEGLDRASLWNADQGLFDRLGVRPEALPTVQPEATSATVSTSLRFELQENAGVPFAYDNGPEGQFHLAETLGGGVGSIDLDCDGAPDLIFVDGGDPVTWPSDRTSRVHLYRHTGEVQFKSATSESRLNWTGYGHGCAVADMNNDGFDDVLLTGYQQSALYLNLGDGTFEESPELRRLAGDRWAATAGWSDLDADGDLDLYLTCYATSPRSNPPVCESKGVRIHCNPHSYGRLPDLLLENLGDGTFQDRSHSSGIGEFQEYGLGVMAADFDGDGSTEIFVANDGDRNLLFRRVSDWVYEDVAPSSGLAFSGQGETMGSMGIACADFDQNGRLDLLTTNFSNESNALFHQSGDLVFADNTQGTLIDRLSRPLVGWSAIPLDADADGLIDLFVANGHVTRMPNEDWAQLPTLLRGSMHGFQEAGQAGSWFERHWHARGACRVDLNRDGLDDLVVSLIDSPAALLVNRSPEPGHTLQVQLVGTTSPRSPEGATIEVESAGRKSLYLASRNAGYLSSHSPVFTVGLGASTQADVIRIRWPSGEQQEFRQVTAGRKVTVIEGRAEVRNERFQPSTK
jgi:enediyne biosynthesis protein E4